MPPFVATCLWFILLVGLLRFDPAKESKTSLALWVPVIWMFIVGSRLPSQWLGGEVGMASQALEEGNAVDRSIFFVLILLAVGILISRSFKWGDFVARNVFLVGFLLFALMSVMWSDFPFVSFKRWFRDLGNYLVILVVLTDPHPLEAVRTLLRRLGYLLIPLSILLIKYYPGIGIIYWTWTGTPLYRGATTDKNLLGAVCLVSGVFFFWDTLMRWPDRKDRRARQIIFVNLAFLAITVWLLRLGNSATSRVCLAIGCLVIAVAHSKLAKRHPFIPKVLVPACFVLYLILAFGFDLNGQLAGAVGRNPTLTDRTHIWTTLLNIENNPLMGAGYESFWLGPRLERIWQRWGIGLNEAHNGYLEIYLNLGIVGLLILCGFLITSYRTICGKLTIPYSLGSLALALWTVTLFYNMTEAAFRLHWMWLVFLLGSISIRNYAQEPASSLSSFRYSEAADRLPGLPIASRRL